MIFLVSQVISPQESFLADPASGLHVRFRLGGQCFLEFSYSFKIWFFEALWMLKISPSCFVSRCMPSSPSGLSFPPAIYYKVFTHNPVTDIGSFAPRDYTKGRAQQPPPIKLDGTHTQGELKSFELRSRVLICLKMPL